MLIVAEIALQSYAKKRCKASPASQFLGAQPTSASTGNPCSTVGIELGVIAFLFFPSGGGIIRCSSLRRVGVTCRARRRE